MNAKKPAKSATAPKATPVTPPTPMTSLEPQGKLARVFIWIQTGVHKQVRKVQGSITAAKERRKAKKNVAATAPIDLVPPSRGIHWFRFFLSFVGALLLTLLLCEWMGWKPTEKVAGWFRGQSSQNQENLTELQKHFVGLAREVDVLKGLIATHRDEVRETQKAISLRQDDIDIGVESVIGEIRAALKKDSDGDKVVKELSDQVAVQTEEIKQLKEKISERKESPAVAVIPAPTPVPAPTVPSVRSSAPKEQLREQDKNGRGLWVGYMYDQGETSMRYSVKEFLLNQIAWDTIPGVEVQAVEGDKITVIHPPITNFGKATHVQFVSRNQPMRVYRLEPRYKLGLNL